MKPPLIELEAIVKSLDEHMVVTRSQSLSLTTQLLAMAKLNLQMTLHEITDQELGELCKAADAEYASITSRSARAGRAETSIRQNGHRSGNLAPSKLEKEEKAVPPEPHLEPDSTVPCNQQRRSTPRSRRRS